MMIALFRILAMVMCLILGFFAACLYSLVRPRHRDGVYHFGHLFANFGRIMGIEVELRYADKVSIPDRAVYIANHQNSYDMFTLPFMLQPGTVSIGKKSLVWIPFFGQIYWLTGNLLIDRNRRTKAAGTLNIAAQKIVERDISVWMFPEGTRSYGRGLLPFKTGAFHLAQLANEPVVPVCCSSTHKQIKLNRWNNGKVIVELGCPIDCTQWTKSNFREEIANVHAQMERRIYELTLEARGEAADYQACVVGQAQGE
jgi:1-acyl-sn-glycerol-3-phosphate acyltransferase